MKRLNVGSGTDRRKNWVNLDYNSEYHPDVIWDLTQLPLPNGIKVSVLQ